MGGLGSTRWFSHSKKTTVQECHILTVKYFAAAALADSVTGGAPIWYSQSIPAAMARLSARAANREPQPKPYGQRFSVSRTPCNYGGYRYWLHCPGCGRRSVKLYKPYYSQRYACRSCHDLTYTSAQEAHKYDRMGGWLGNYARKLDRATQLGLLYRTITTRRSHSKAYRRAVVKMMEMGVIPIL